VKLSELTYEQLLLIAVRRPRWVIANRPAWIAACYPGYPGLLAPDYVAPELPEEIEKLLKGVDE